MKKENNKISKDQEEIISNIKKTITHPSVSALIFGYLKEKDLNLKEIADNNNISRSYVGKYIKQIEDKLIEYEKCLNIYEKNNKIREIIKFSDLKERIEEIL